MANKVEYKGYIVYKDGTIIGRKGQPRKFNICKNGYSRFGQYNKIKKGVQNTLHHRFIWEAFNGQIPNNKEIDHIDNNKHNNKLDNLQLLTKSENCLKRESVWQ